MTRNQKIIIISVSSALIGGYLSVFIYQRIQRAKADALVVSEEEALKILNEKSYIEPNFTEDDTMPQIPDSYYDDTTDYGGLTDLQIFDIQSGMGDF
jgi:hypothetical protein